MIRVRFIIGTVTNLVSFIDEYSLEETPQMGDFVLLNKITYEVEKRIWHYQREPWLFAYEIVVSQQA